MDSGASRGAAGDGGARQAAPAAARLHLWQIQGVRDVVVILALVAIVYLGYWMRSVTVPLLIALVLAYLFEPVVQRLCRFRGITRPGAVLIILLTVGVGVTIAGTLTLPRAISETVNLVREVRSTNFRLKVAQAIEYVPERYRESLTEAVDWFMGEREPARAQSDASPAPTGGAATDDGSEPTNGSPDAQATPPDAPAEQRSATDEAIDEVTDGGAGSTAEDERIREVVREEIAAMGLAQRAEPALATPAPGAPAAPWKILGALGTTVETVGAFLVWVVQFSLIAFLVPFYFYFFSVSFPAVTDFGRSLIPVRHRPRTLELIGAMDRAVSGFVRGRIVIAGIMGILFAIGWLLCGVPYAITLGIFVGALSLVPYLGGIGVPLAVGFLLFNQLQLEPADRMAWWAILLWPTAVFVLVQTIEGYLLTPVIAGKATDLDPVTIVVAILAGGSVAGVYGMILAIPAAACGKIILKEVLLPRIRAWSRGEVSDPLPLETTKES